MARLKAPCTVAEASVGALRAFCSTRVCTAGTIAKPNSPTSITVTAADQRACAVTANSARVAESSTKAAQTVGRSARSAANPPSTLPMVIPTPNSASTRVTEPVAYPETSVSSGAM